MPRKTKNPVLDLHGTKHADVEKAVDVFIFENRDHSGVMKIITGNSGRMKNIVLDILSRYSFDKIRIGDIINNGYIKIYT